MFQNFSIEHFKLSDHWNIMFHNFNVEKRFLRTVRDPSGNGPPFTESTTLDNSEFKIARTDDRTLVSVAL